MEKNEVKDLTMYNNRFEEDPSSFTDFQAMDYVRELKNQGKLDEAIEVGKTFLQVGENLTLFINQYGYALYNKYINIDEEAIASKESLFFSMVEEICSLCTFEKYSPVEATVNKAIRYLLNKSEIDYKKISQLLDKLDPLQLSAQPFKNNEGKEFESKKEKWYRLKVRCLYELEDYKECVQITNKAFTQPIKWHNQTLNWMKYYRASSLVSLKRYEEAENEFMSLGNRLPHVDSFEILFDLYMNTDRQKEAYTSLLYKFFVSGYDYNNMSLYLKLLDMVKTNEHQKELIELTEAFIYKLKTESHESINDLTISETYQSYNSSHLYDRLYNLLMEHLDAYIERFEGTIVYYNEEKEFGSIGLDDADNLFFRQSDYIYDEDVKKRDVVEYSVMKTYDTKKQMATFKAILIKTLYEDINY